MERNAQLILPKEETRVYLVIKKLSRESWVHIDDIGDFLQKADQVNDPHYRFPISVEKGTEWNIDNIAHTLNKLLNKGAVEHKKEDDINYFKPNLNEKTVWSPFRDETPDLKGEKDE